MVDRRSILYTMIQSILAIGIISVFWIVIGWGLLSSTAVRAAWWSLAHLAGTVT
jgi:ammonia channel protein AmtB